MSKTPQDSPLPVLNKLVLIGVTAATSALLPPNSVIREVLAQGTNANAVTGGLKFGTAAAGVDIVAALAVAGNSLNFVTDALLLKRWFSVSAAQQIFIDAVTAWNSANVNITILYENLSNG